MLDNDQLAKGAPGLLGALSAMLWLRETGIRRVAAVLIGSAISYFGTPFGLTVFDSFDAGLMGYLLGLFGMAVVAKVFELLDSLSSKEILERVLKRMGL